MKSPVLRSICCVVLLALVACGDRSPAPSGHYRVYEFSKGPYKAIGFVGLKSPGLEAAYCEHTNYVNRQVKFFAAALEKDPSSEGAERLFERFEAERDVAETMGQSARFGWLHWFPYVSRGEHAAVLAGRDQGDAYDFYLLIRWPDTLNWGSQTNVILSIFDELLEGIRKDAPTFTNLSPIVTRDGRGFVPEVGLGLDSVDFLQQQ
jgi:hypothetical protein